MSIKHILWAALAVLASVFACSAPAQAQATRTWVSGLGDNANPCSRNQPCQTFAGAILKTAAGGEINCLDSAGYGPLTITRSITIDCTGTTSSVLNSGTNGVVINDSATDTPGTIVVILRNLSINGAGGNPSLNGIRVLSGKAVYVSNVIIQNQSGASPNGCGVYVASTSAMRVYLRNVESIRNRVGVCITGTGAVSNSMFIEGSTLENNTSNSMVLTGSNAVVVATGSVFAPTAVSLSGGASFASTGNNRISGPVGPTSILPLQ